MEYQILEDAKGAKNFIAKVDFKTQSGGVINPLVLTYETYGVLSPQKDNVIVVHHALSPSHHLSATSKNPEKGWWNDMVGAGRALDTDRYFIICINNVGSCFGSSGPASINPKTGKPYRAEFPTLVIEDIVNSQRLLLQELGIKTCYAMIGNSMGGMISLSWAIQYPSSVQRLLLISSCYKAYPANIANRIVQREIIQLDPEWHGGFYEKEPVRGLKIARKLGHFTYRNAIDLNRKFQSDSVSETQTEMENYLEYKSNQFVSQFDVNCYLTILYMMDNFDVTAIYNNKVDAFKRIQANMMVVSVNSDILFIPQQQQELVDMLIKADKEPIFIEHSSSYGHDAFLVETDVFSRYIRQCLAFK